MPQARGLCACVLTACLLYTLQPNGAVKEVTIDLEHDMSGLFLQTVAPWSAINVTTEGHGHVSSPW